jgi:hypothetical protein
VSKFDILISKFRIQRIVPPYTKATVKGANTPEIERLSVELTPNSADADDLDENPMYVRRKEEEAAVAAPA